MRITIEHEGLEASVKDENVITLEQTLDLMEYALRGVGFAIEMETLHVRRPDTADDAS